MTTTITEIIVQSLTTPLKWFMHLLANKNNNTIKKKSLGCGTDEIDRLFPFWSALGLFCFLIC